MHPADQSIRAKRREFRGRETVTSFSAVDRRGADTSLFPPLSAISACTHSQGNGMIDANCFAVTSISPCDVLNVISVTFMMFPGIDARQHHRTDWPTPAEALGRADA